jgi:acyl-coenzyme A synthetase/AMP-(fatty) acid ligase
VVGVTDATKGTVPVAFLTLLDAADPGQVREDVSAEVASQQAVAAQAAPRA